MSDSLFQNARSPSSPFLRSTVASVPFRDVLVNPGLYNTS